MLAASTDVPNTIVPPLAMVGLLEAAGVQAAISSSEARSRRRIS